jgi:hypothetical protein
MVVKPDFDTFVTWLARELSPKEARYLHDEAKHWLDNALERSEATKQPNPATQLEASLESFVDTLGDYHQV